MKASFQLTLSIRYIQQPVEGETMYSANLDDILNSGYAFLKNLSDTETIYENKFTGLWLVYNTSHNSYRVMEG